jgi:protein dithiol oxidoreductase (disulfide-forming)
MQLRHLLAVSLLVIGAPASAQLLWQQGVDYQLIAAPQRAGAPEDKIEVAEAFSYGCPYCYKAKDNVARLALSLPPDAAMTYVHASFVPAEGWPVLQRAFYTASKLGLAESQHEAMFKAIWETGEVPMVDVTTGRMRKLPTIEELAKFYTKGNAAKTAEFVKLAGSPGIDAAVQHADALVKAWRIPGTPAIVVNGRYLVNNEYAFDKQARITQFLITLERTRLAKK